LDNLKELEVSIEEYRKRLYHTILIKRRLTDPETIYISQQLDGLLNEYSRRNLLNDYNRKDMNIVPYIKG
jgi:hypothetical protein